jgi:uncharacterized protein
MFITFFQELKSAGVPVTPKEYLALMEGLAADLPASRVEDFYYLARVCLVFGQVFRGLELMTDTLEAKIPEEWLKVVSELNLSDEDKTAIAELGGWDKIMEELKKRLEEQKGRHQGGNKWIGTGGKSPYGAYGYNPAGVRIGQDKNRNFRAIKVWDKREFKDLDDNVEIGTRNAKGLRKNSISTARSRAPRTRAISTFTCGRSGAMR